MRVVGAFADIKMWLTITGLRVYNLHENNYYAKIVSGGGMSEANKIGW
jgi:hypothetical protein